MNPAMGAWMIEVQRPGGARHVIGSAVDRATMHILVDALRAQYPNWLVGSAWVPEHREEPVAGAVP